MLRYGRARGNPARAGTEPRPYVMDDEQDEQDVCGFSIVCYTYAPKNLATGVGFEAGPGILGGIGVRRRLHQGMNGGSPEW